MRPSVTTAVILAAGLGSRLKDRTREKPKAFLEINGKSLIVRSIENLLSRGIQKIIIGTGYMNQYFDSLRDVFPQVITMRNSEFASTGSMYTLFVLREVIDKPFLLLEGDLLYEPAALDNLLQDSVADIILGSDATHSGDEVYIQCSVDGFLQVMNKNKNALAHVDAELIGISKLSLEGYHHMVAYAEEKYLQGIKDIHYEDAFVGIAATRNITIKIVKDLAWCEIDDEQHLNRALSVVYPKILERSAS